jgi:hypothetical protein
MNPGEFYVFFEIGKDPKSKKPIFGLQIYKGNDVNDLEEDVHRHAINLANQKRTVFVVNGNDISTNIGS